MQKVVNGDPEEIRKNIECRRETRRADSGKQVIAGGDNSQRARR